MKANRQPEEGWEEARDELQGKKKCKGGDDLFALIRAKQSEKESAFDGMMTALEAKYGGKEAKGKRGKGRK